MLEVIYIILAVIFFLGRLQNGVIVALLQAVFWPIFIVGIFLSILFIFFFSLYRHIKQ